MSQISRRQFLGRSVKVAAIGGALVVGASTKPKKVMAKSTMTYGTFIDLTLCDGCSDKDTPACVTACRDKNKQHYPEPKDPLLDYWPQKHHEDWRGQRDSTSRLTPYNWTYVQNVKVTADDGTEHDLHIQRRCMHCDNPACANLCPFGVHNKLETGAVVIDKDYCMGGAKCRDTCPWEIPQRQAGVGLYMKLMPKFAGGGVMYKCDFCHDLLKVGERPVCASACPKNAIIVGDKAEIKQLANERAQDINGYVYGDKENSGTSTFYVSPVPFAKIDQALREQEVVDGKLGAPHMKQNVENMLDSTSGYAMSVLIAPIAGAVAAGVMAHKTLKGEQDNE